jgi:hypothetical protein
MAKRTQVAVFVAGVSLVAAGVTPLACDTFLGLHDPVTVPDDAADEAPRSPDAGDAHYPAFRPRMPQMVAVNAGAVIPAPTAYPVLFPGDSMATYNTVATAVSTWVDSGLWKAQVDEYNIVDVKLEPVISGSIDPPLLTAVNDHEIQSWLEAQLDGTQPEFGAIDEATLANEVFVLLYPSTTTITAAAGKSCKDFTAYHSELVLDAKLVLYAVVADCGGSAADLTKATSMIGIATATNPRPSRPGYVSFDQAHLAWNYLNGSADASPESRVPMTELPQPCAGETYPLPDSGLPIARSWSNAHMNEYHDPCVPVSGSAAYFMSVPVMNDDLMLPGQYPTKGVRLAAGQHKTIEVELLSDGPTDGRWTVSAKVLAPFDTNSLEFAFDGTEGKNGDVLHLTITAKGSNPVVFAVVSTLGTKQTTWAGFVAP